MKKKQIIGIISAVVLIAVYAGIKIYASNTAKEKIDKTIVGVASYADIDYGDVSVDLLGLAVHVSDVVVSPTDFKEKIYINEIVVHEVDGKSDIPTSLNVSLNGIKLNVGQLGDDAKKIKDLGYDNDILLNLAIDYNYDREKKELNLKKLSVGADEVGDIEIGIQLGNIDLNPEKIIAILFTYPTITLHKATISYSDDSLAERLFKLTAKENKISVEKVKSMAIENFEKNIAKEEDDFSKKTLGEVISFIKDPEVFSISITPEKPFPLGRLTHITNPKDFIKLLKIKIES